MVKDEDPGKDQRIKEFIESPGFEFFYRHSLLAVRMMSSVKEDNTLRSQILRTYGDEESFLTIYSLDYGLYQYVRSRELRKDWYWNQVEQLDLLILLDLLSPQSSYPKIAERASYRTAGNDGHVIGQNRIVRNFQRVRKTYPEIFMPPSESIERGRVKRDERISRFSTVFGGSKADNSDDGEHAQAMELMMVHSGVTTGLVMDNEGRQDLMARFRMVDSKDVEGLERFHMIQNAHRKIITSPDYAPLENSWLVPHIERGSLLSETIYQNISLAISLQWFRTIKSEDARKAVFKQRHKIRYSREDAKASIKANLRWIGNTASVADLTFRGASAYDQVGMKDSALYLYEECLKLDGLEKMDAGLCHNNMAAVYLSLGRPRKGLSHLNSTLKLFQEIDSPIDVAVTKAHISEAYHFLNKPDKCQYFWEESTTALSAMDCKDHRVPEAFIFIADCAYRMGDRRLEKQASFLGMKSSDKGGHRELRDYFDLRLHYLELDLDTLEEERKNPFVRRPPMFPWDKGPSNLIARLPRGDKQDGP